jgi:quinoprotein glucose dehydrogenase
MPAVYESNGREYIVFCAAGRDSARTHSIPGQPASQASPIHGNYISFALPQ